jgi:hypothetical protein
MTHPKPYAALAFEHVLLTYIICRSLFLSLKTLKLSHPRLEQEQSSQTRKGILRIMLNLNFTDQLEPRKAGQVAHTSEAPSPVPPPLHNTSDKNPLSIALGNLHQACSSGDLALVQFIFADFGQDFAAEDNIADKLRLSVVRAALAGHAHIISYLLAHGADVKSGPLFAIQHKDADAAVRVLEVLFDYGLDLEEFPNLLAYVLVPCEHITMLRSNLIQLGSSAREYHLASVPALKRSRP